MTAFAVFLAVLFTMLSPFAGARAQDGQPGLMANGDLAVTGFSGTKQLGGETFIDTDGASLKIFDVSGKGQARGQLIGAPTKFEAFARDIGQVFGVALDNAPQPNIYVTSTTTNGLQIVIPDNNGDGIPERVSTGQPGATFMEGQFGTALGGGPGSVWRIDGTSGEISLFADIKLGGMPNSGPGLGNITFDPAHFQFYVSDLDTGFIHSLDLSGNDLGTFDHGVQGRPAAGLPQVVMNFADRMDITSLAFDSNNSSTWNLADNQRRVWGLAYYSGRLYYGVGDGPQIWSVGINTDGGFANDARVEIQSVPGGFPVSDILFTPRGKMVLAQRGGIAGSKEYTAYHMPKNNRVLRYSRDETGNWVQEPEEYAIGFPVDYRNASGGIGLTCDGTLWSTGDSLRDNPALADRLTQGGPLVVHGLQGNKLSLVRPFNTPPWSSWFVDYDGQFADPEKAGHVGDVEVYRNCGSRAESFPGWYPIPEWYPPEGWEPPEWWPEYPDLDLEKIASECVAVPGIVPTYQCKYTIVVTNVGAADYVGLLHVVDNPPATALYIPLPGGSIPWNCAQPGGAGTPISCDSANVETLHPGEAETLEITIQVTPGNTDNYVRNCAIVDDHHHGDNHGHNEDCDEAKLPRPDLEIEKTFYDCFIDGINWRCSFVISITNVGGAAYSGPLHFVENIPAGTVFGGIFGSTTPGWACIGGPPIECTLPDPPGVTMNPGDVELIGISILVPFGLGGNMENCVNLGNPEHAGDPVAPGVNNACVPFSVPLPVVLKKHACPAGWTEVPPAGAPAGWPVIAVDGVNPDGTKWGIMCMKPKPVEKISPVHKCPAGWTKVPPQGAPAGYKVLAVDGVNPDGTKWGIMCMKPKPKPPAHKCPAGWTKVPPQGAPAGYQVLAVDGVNPDGTKWGIMCMKPRKVTQPNPTCEYGERRYTNRSGVPQGWTSRRVTRGKRTIYCAKPPLVVPRPFCNKGETTYQSARQIPKGWTWRSVVVGKRKIYCAKPGSITPIPPRPQCIGGKLVMLKTLPPRWLCKCPRGWSNVKGTCKRRVIHPTPPTVKLCPKYWRRVKGVCKPPRIQTVPPKVKLCPKNWRRVKGVCKPPRIQTVPKQKLKLQIKPKRKLKTKSVMKLNRSISFKPTGAGRMYR